MFATSGQFKQVAEAMRVENGNIRNFGSATGNWTIDVAGRWLTIRMPCCRLQHSGSVEVEQGDQNPLLRV